MVRVIIEIQKPVLDIVSRIILKYRSNVIMKIDPVLPVKEEDTDSDQIRHILIVVLPVDIFVLVRLLALFADDLLQQMPCLFGPIAVRVNPCFLNVIQIIVNEILADLL